MRKYVVSSTLSDAAASWNNTTVIRGDVANEVAKLKRQDGLDILVAGSGQLVRTLIEYDLVDAYRLMVYPIVLGTGRRLFSSSTQARLILTSATSSGDGVLMLTYEPQHAPAT